jgi:hypothetical protein
VDVANNLVYARGYDLMRTALRLLSSTVTVVLFGAAAGSLVSGQNARPAIVSDADFRRAMKELSNWGRWGETDELGAANLITPAKRKQALTLAREGRSVSLAHDIPQEKAADTPTFLDRALVTVAPNVALDRYQYTGTYHGSFTAISTPWTATSWWTARGITACPWRTSRRPAAARAAVSTP